MTELFQCYRCGTALNKLTLPFSRQDQCPACAVYVHCCRMCEFYDPSVAEKCREDDADEVKNKENANFCDYFRPITGLYDPALRLGERNAREQLDAMFGAESDDAAAAQGAPDSAADDLFK